MIIRGFSSPIKNNDDAEENHAQMLIEGIDNGKHFLKKAHLSKIGKLGKVKIRDLNPAEIEDVLKFQYRGEIKIAHRTRMKKMIRGIEKEEALGSVTFNIFGNMSLLSRKTSHSCISWVLDKYDNFFYGKGVSELGLLKKLKQKIITNPMDRVKDKNSYSKLLASELSTI